MHLDVCGQQVEEDDPAPLLGPGEVTPGVSSSQYQTEKELLERVQQRARNMMRGLEHLLMRLRELGLLGKEKTEMHINLRL